MSKSMAKKSRSEARPSGVSATPADQLLRRLNGYAMAASAAGVALLACSNSAEASPVCGSLSVTLPYTETYAFNPAHQKQAPFNVAHTFNDLSSFTQSLQVRGFFTPNTPDAQVMASTNGLPTELASGAMIGPGGNFGKGKDYGLLFGYYYPSRFKGNFQPNQSGYVGFLFIESGQTHYSWLRLRIANLNGEFYPSLLLSEFGYESSPNTAITAGSCAGSGSSAESPSLSESMLATKAAGAPTLGALASGSQALPSWRTGASPRQCSSPAVSKSYAGDQS
jgi:hypothetical protein